MNVINISFGGARSGGFADQFDGAKVGGVEVRHVRTGTGAVHDNGVIAQGSVGIETPVEFVVVEAVVSRVGMAGWWCLGVGRS